MQSQNLLLTLTVFLALSLPLRGQTRQTFSTTGPQTGIYRENRGKVTITQDPRLNVLLERHKNTNKAKGGINGYRIQIYFGSGRTARADANEAKATFLSYFPGTEAHILYQTPFYKVRAGDFRTKNDALKIYRQVQRKFPNAYIVPDIIQFPALDGRGGE